MADKAPTLGEVVCTLGDAYKPLRDAWLESRTVSDFEPALRAVIRTYGVLTGRPEESLAADVTAAAQRLRVALLVHLFAEQLAEDARTAIATEVDRVALISMLKKTRQAVRLLEKNLFSETTAAEKAVDGEKVVAISKPRRADHA